MGTLTEVLDNIRSSGALIGQNRLAPPWAIRQEGGTSITVAAMLRGEAWLRQAGHDPVPLRHRDLAILTGPGSTLLTSAPHRAGLPHVRPDRRRHLPRGDGAAHPR